MDNVEPKYSPPFEAGKIYHIYNRANNQDLLFYKEQNYRYFLKKYENYLSNYLETFAYCLLPNHFHLMIQVKRQDSSSQNLNNRISEQFRRLFISYSQAINKQEKRRGSPFQKSFKRKLIEDSSYLTQLVLYIHFNPVKHKLTDNVNSYKWSSFGSILSKSPTKIHREEVISWFGDREAFLEYNNNYSTQEISRKFKTEL